MAKRQNRLLQNKQDVAPAPPPLPPSPLMQSRMARVATHMTKEVAPISNQQAFKTNGFGWFKLFFGLVATVVDFVTNHNFISPNSVTPVSVALAFLLMVSEFFLLYSYYAWREHQAEGRAPEAAKFLGLLIICIIATIVDFVATVIPVRTLLIAGGSDIWIALFMGVLAAAFTSIMQMDFYPNLLMMVTSLLGKDNK